MPITRIFWLFAQSFVTNAVFYGLLDSIAPALFAEIGENIYTLFVVEIIAVAIIIGLMSMLDDNLKEKGDSIRETLGDKAKKINLKSWYADFTFGCTLAINGYIVFKIVSTSAVLEYFIFALLGSLAIGSASVVGLQFLETKRLGAIQATIQLLKPEAETE